MPLLRENFLSEHLICCVNEVPRQEMAPLFTYLDYTSTLLYWYNIMIAASVCSESNFGNLGVNKRLSFWADCQQKLLSLAIGT